MCLPIFAGIGAAMGASAASAAAVGTATVASVAAAGISAYSSYESGQSQKKAGEYNAKMQQNAAEAAAQKGASLAGEETDKARRIAGIQRSQMAAGGTDITTGSSLDLLSETAGMGQLNALRQINNAQREAYGLNASAELDLYKGKAAEKAGYLNAAGGMLSGAAGAYASFSKFK